MFSRISKLFMVCIMLIAICLVHQVEAGTWTRKADMPTARYLPGSAVVDGKIYVIGGAPVPFGDSRTVEAYDPATDTWTRHADMPSARQGGVAAAVDGIIYAIAGFRGNPRGYIKTVEAYDPATNIWTKKSDMPPTGKTIPAIAVVDEIIYVIGGFGDGDPDPGPPWLCSPIVYAYDTATDQWIRKADMPTGRHLLTACVIDGRIYVAGGRPEWDSENCLPTVEVYDPATDNWTQTSDMPSPRMGHTASVIDGKMYIIGGLDRGLVGLFNEGKIGLDEVNKLSSIVNVYDPATDTWTTADSITTPRTEATAAVVDGRVYVIGGTWGPASTPLSVVEEYDPALSDASSSVSPGGKLLETWGRIRKMD